MAEWEYTNFILKQHENGSSGMVNLGKMAAKIAYYNFEWRFLTLVLFDTMRIAVCLEAFLISYNKPVVLKFGEYTPRYRVKVIQFVIFGQDTNQLSHLLAWLVKSQYDVSARFIIVCANDDHKICDQDEAFKTISKVFMVNSVYLQSTEGEDEPSAFTYFPVKPNKCTNKIPEEIKIDFRCSNHSCRTVFPEKLDNYFGCSLYISTIHQPPFMYLRNDYDVPYGADGAIIKMVAAILNATLRMKLPADQSEWGHSVDNNNWTGSLGDVFNKRVHASMASIPITPAKNGNFQISFPYYSMDMVWTTRLPHLKPSWEKLLRPLKVTTRLALSAIFLLIIIINAFLKTKTWSRIRIPLNIARSKSNLLFKSYITFLGIPVSRIPIKPAFRLIVINWLWFSFILRCAYQATLYNTLRTAYYDEAFNDIRDAIKAGYTYGGTTSLREYYSEEQDIFENWKELQFDNIFNAIARTTDGNDVAVAANKASVIHYLTLSNGSKHLQIIPRQIVTSPTVLYFQKFSSFAPAINRILIVLVEAGFIDMLYARYLDHDIELFEHSPVYGTTALGFDYFTTCFILLAIGWLVSAAYFTIEVFCKPPRE